MLIMSRKKNESIVINNDITVTIVEIRGDKVRLGVVCPKDVPVHRQEVYDAIYAMREEPRPVVVPVAPGATMGDETAITLSDRFTIDPQYVLRFQRTEEHAQRVVDFLASMGVYAETTYDGQQRAVLSADQYRRLTEKFRFRNAR